MSEEAGVYLICVCSDSYFLISMPANSSPTACLGVRHKKRACGITESCVHFFRMPQEDVIRSYSIDLSSMSFCICLRLYTVRSFVLLLVDSVSC